MAELHVLMQEKQSLDNAMPNRALLTVLVHSETLLYVALHAEAVRFL